MTKKSVTTVSKQKKKYINNIDLLSMSAKINHS